VYAKYFRSMDIIQTLKTPMTNICCSKNQTLGPKRRNSVDRVGRRQSVRRKRLSFMIPSPFDSNGVPIDEMANASRGGSLNSITRSRNASSNFAMKQRRSSFAANSEISDYSLLRTNRDNNSNLNYENSKQSSVFLTILNFKKTLFGEVHNDKDKLASPLTLNPKRSASNSPTNGTSLNSHSPTSRVRRQSSFNQLQAVQKMKRKGNYSHNKSLDEMRHQFINYFITQLYLAADLCLDRNYVSIGILEKRLPYTLLLTMLKSSYVMPRMKAPICRVLKCLYVDREPQVPIKFPRLIRTSVSLSGQQEHDYKKVPQCFALIQQIISSYIHNELDCTDCDDLSTEMMSLLESLMMFGFYSSQSQLQDIINPLVQVL
jgi:hypothetical protein